MKKESKTLLDLLGVETIKQINSSKEIEALTKQVTGKKLEALFEVDKSSEKTRFDNWLAKQTNKNTHIQTYKSKKTKS